MEVVRTRWANELAAWRSTPTLFHAPGGESLVDAAASGAGGAGHIVAEFAAGRTAARRRWAARGL